jgi:hypothetical protein
MPCLALILCFYSGQSPTCSLRARSLPLFWPCLPVRPWVRGGVRGFPEEAPIESEVAHPSHSARRTAPCAMCSVFIDIYKLYVAGFPLCALVTACCGCLETAAYSPPPRQALGTRSSHAPHTLLTRVFVSSRSRLCPGPCVQCRHSNDRRARRLRPGSVDARGRGQGGQPDGRAVLAWPD